MTWQNNSEANPQGIGIVDVCILLYDQLSRGCNEEIGNCKPRLSETPMRPKLFPA